MNRTYMGCIINVDMFVWFFINIFHIEVDSLNHKKVIQPKKKKKYNFNLLAYVQYSIADNNKK